LEEEIIIRKFNEKDKDQIISLLDSVFGGWPRQDIEGTKKQFWEWKYIDRPKPCYISVAEHKNRIVGTYHATRADIKIGGNLYPCTTTWDMVVHEDYRGMGLSKRLGSDFNRSWRRNEGIIYGYSIVGNPILVKSFDKTRPKFPVEVINLVRIDDLQLHFKYNIHKNPLILKQGYRVLSRLQNTLNFFRQGLDGCRCKVVEVNKFDTDTQDLWHRVSEDYDFIIERSMEVLNHRYCHEKNPKYRVLQATQGKEILGYTALRINRYNKEYPIGYIADLIGLKGEDRAIHQLLKEAIRYFREKNVNIVNLQIPQSHPYIRIARLHGFLDSRVKLHLYCVPTGDIDPIKDQSIDPERAFVSWGDHDVLPASTPDYD
jgi:GNAT superfamily N-acetyltransferase